MNTTREQKGGAGSSLQEGSTASVRKRDEKIPRRPATAGADEQDAARAGKIRTSQLSWVENPVRYEGADWLERKGKSLSELGRRAADIVGQVWRGIYHLEHEALAAEWSAENVAALNIRESLATFDHQRLSELVVLCHDACIRLRIEPRTHSHLRLFFCRRRRDGAIHERHPTMEQAIESVRSRLGLGGKCS